MKRRDLEKHLREHGCELHHHGGRHDIWINLKTQARAPVPRHKEMPKIGTVRGICRQLGVPSPV
ncbi:MAG: type II toxin-antitoxin system HicA family toxin [Planctomycetota bacterium]